MIEVQGLGVFRKSLRFQLQGVEVLSLHSGTAKSDYMLGCSLQSSLEFTDRKSRDFGLQDLWCCALDRVGVPAERWKSRGSRQALGCICFVSVLHGDL